MARAKEKKGFSVEFPILVYHEDDRIFAQCLTTCTIAEGDTEEDALESVIELLKGSMEDALEETGNDAEAALRMLLCFAEDRYLQMWFSAQELKLPNLRLPKQFATDGSARASSPTRT